MSRIAYVNGAYVPHRDAAVHIEDRGYQFADGVYEVIAVQGGRLVDERPHLDRLDRSLAELRIRPPMSREVLRGVMREVLRRNYIADGSIYIQMTRGVAPRDHAFPAKAATSVVMTAKRARVQPTQMVEDGIRVVTVPDIRWGRCDIKTVSLLPNVLAKQQAKQAGAYEAWLVDRDGHVTEGSSTNAWIVTKDGKLVTRAATQAILNGITRQAVIKLARNNGLKLEERAFSVEDAKTAREAFLTSTTSHVLAVTQIDDTVIGNGKAGSFALKLRAIYLDYAEGPGASS
ncbi:MAG TPA: D-amino-acid transaminase [Alphaproteobacteria bacterium]|nr:D-amino-acid transaminase [Alphaproteobacteria bacterium]